MPFSPAAEKRVKQRVTMGSGGNPIYLLTDPWFLLKMFAGMVLWAVAYGAGISIAVSAYAYAAGLITYAIELVTPLTPYSFGSKLVSR